MSDSDNIHYQHRSETRVVDWSNCLHVICVFDMVEVVMLVVATHNIRNVTVLICKCVYDLLKYGQQLTRCDIFLTMSEINIYEDVSWILL